MEKSITRVALYLRTTKEELLKEDLDNIVEMSAQQKACDEFCTQQFPNMKWVATFRDIDSGTLPVAERPGLKSLLEKVVDGTFDAVVVYRVERLSRNLKVLLDVVHKLEENNVVLYSTKEPFNTSDATGRMTLHMLAAFAAAEREVLSQRRCECSNCY